MQNKHGRECIALPHLMPLRTDEFKPEGILRRRINELVELIDNCNAKQQEELFSNKSLLQGQWITKYTMPASMKLEGKDFFENPEKQTEILIRNLQFAKRTRDKNILIKLMQYDKEIYERFTELKKDDSEQLEHILSICGTPLFRFNIDLFILSSQPIIMKMMNFLYENMADDPYFIQSLQVIKASEPDIPPNAPDNESTRKYYRERHERSKGTRIADGIESAALKYIFTGSARDTDAVKRGLKLIDKYHGTIHGAYTSNDYLAGRSPNTPMDIYAASKYYRALFSIFLCTGDISIADRMEVVMCNLLPAFVKDGKIQIMQSVNQCNYEKSSRPWKYAKVKNSNFYAPSKKADAVEALSSATIAVRQTAWLTMPDNGLAMIFPFEGIVAHSINGKIVKIKVESQYPYSGDVKMIFITEDPVSFSLSIRIPKYTTGATVSYNKQAAQPAVSGDFYVVSQSFKTGDVIRISIPMSVKINNYYRRSCSINYGPIIMAYPLPDDAKEYQNIAVDPPNYPTVDDKDGEISLTLNAYSFEGKWKIDEDIPLLPECDMNSAEEIRLVPYAKTINRIAQFPTVGINNINENSENTENAGKE